MEKGVQTEDSLDAIHRLELLPPLSRQAQQLLTALGDPELDPLRLVAILRQSPSLAARILGIARSAFFAGPLPPRDLEDAVIRFLGLALVRDLAIAFTLTTPLCTDDCTAFQALRYWRHALLTASLAEGLATGNDIPNGDQAYLAGLLHNLGLLALVHMAAPQMQRIFLETDDAERDNAGGLSLSTLEQRRLGVDHCRAGQQLATAWKLPEEIGAAMSFHRDIRYRGRHRELVILTALAERHCSYIGSAATLPDEELSVLLDGLGIGHAIWTQALADWQPQIGRIMELAGKFQ